MPNTPSPRPDVAGIEARAEAATEGPWFAGALYEDVPGASALTIGTFEAKEHYEDTICEVWGGNHDAVLNGQLIAHARQDIPALIAYIRKLEKVLVALGYGKWGGVLND